MTSRFEGKGPWGLKIRGEVVVISPIAVTAADLTKQRGIVLIPS